VSDAGGQGRSLEDRRLEGPLPVLLSLLQLGEPVALKRGHQVLLKQGPSAVVYQIERSTLETEVEGSVPGPGKVEWFFMRVVTV